MASGGRIVFQDFTGEVTEAIENALLNGLEEGSSELEAQVTTRTSDRDVAQKWTHRVDRNNLTAYVGNPLENALWIEFGTGEYALKGDGRKGYWVYVRADGTQPYTRYTYKNADKNYTLQEAKQIAAFLKSKGLDAVITSGSHPQRPLHHAFVNNEEDIKNAIREKLRNV